MTFTTLGDNSVLVGGSTPATGTYDVSYTGAYSNVTGVRLEVLEDAGQDLNRASFLDAVNRAGIVDLGGVEMTFGPGDNQGMNDVFLTRITADGTFEPIMTGGS